MTGVIVNADDFGLTRSCSAAIAQAFCEGLVTDTTMTANGAFFSGAAELARQGGFFRRIGIHFNITEGEPLTDAMDGMMDFVADGRFHKGFDPDRSLTDEEQEAVYTELTAQVRRLKAEGITITHADSHHYVHNLPAVAPIVIRVCRESGIEKIRLEKNCGALSDEQRARAEAYNEWLRGQGMVTTRYFMRAADICSGIPDLTEVLVHPDLDCSGRLIDRRGMADGSPVGDPLPDLRKVSGVALINYRELSNEVKR